MVTKALFQGYKGIVSGLQRLLHGYKGSVSGLQRQCYIVAKEVLLKVQWVHRQCYMVTKPLLHGYKPVLQWVLLPRHSYNMYISRMVLIVHA